MTRVLLTGASGFVGAYILRYLIEAGYSVVAVVRSQAKADQIRAIYPVTPASNLSFAIVPDMTKAHAFDDAVRSDRPFAGVIHAASPFNFTSSDIQRDMLDPAVKGTTEILKSIKAHAPGVKRVVITSSAGAIARQNVGPDYVYTDADWNGLTQEQAVSNPYLGYMASKSFAERAAWDFVEAEKPKFTLTTLVVVHVFGPLLQAVSSIDNINTSAELVNNFITGKFKSEVPANPYFNGVDVRDTALAHLRALEAGDAAAGKRFIISGFPFSHHEVGQVLYDNLKSFRNVLPDKTVPGGEYPKEGIPKFDAKPSEDILGLKYTPLSKSIIDMAASLQGISMRQ